MADAPAARLDASAPAAAPAPQAQTRAQGSGSTQSATPSTAWLGSRLALGLLIALICVVPFVLVLIISLGNKIEGAGWEWGLSLANYSRFFFGIGWPETVSTLYAQKLFYSLYFAVLASLIAVLVAFPFTYLLTRLSRRAQAGWLILLLSSVSLSEVFVVMGWDVLLSNRSGLPMVFRETGLTAWLKGNGGLDLLREWGLASPRNIRFKTSAFATVTTMVYLVFPYAVILLYPALSRIDPAMMEAARTMGARPLMVIRTVVLPAVRVPVIGAVLLLFVFLLGAYVAITVFAAPAQQTLTVSIYDSIRGQTINAPFGAAQAVVLLVTAALFLGASSLIAKRSGL